MARTTCGMRFSWLPLIAIALDTLTAAESITVFFSPKGGCTEAIVSEVNKATNSVHIQAYSFTSAPIAESVADAHRRGVKVAVILDKSQRTGKYSSADYLKNAGVHAVIDDNHAIAHNKIIVIDGQTVITGSFNFSKAAEESNAENLLIIRDQSIAHQYTTNWQAHFKHSENYISRMEAK